jgi:hypothetical protein
LIWIVHLPSNSKICIPLFTSAVGCGNYFITFCLSKRANDLWDQLCVRATGRRHPRPLVRVIFFLLRARGAGENPRSTSSHAHGEKVPQSWLLLFANGGGERIREKEGGGDAPATCKRGGAKPVGCCGGLKVAAARPSGSRRRRPRAPAPFGRLRRRSASLWVQPSRLSQIFCPAARLVCAPRHHGVGDGARNHVHLLESELGRCL